LKQYFNVRDGNTNPKGTTIPRQGQFVPDAGKTMNDVAEAIGEDLATTQRLLKINDLISEL
jgi:ParB family chromosome partitioning protein